MTMIAASHSLPWHIDPTFWTGVTSLMFFVLIFRLGAKPLSTALRGRQRRVEEQLHQAEEARKVVRELRLKQEERRRQAKIDAAAMIEEAKRDAEHTRSDMIERAGEEIEKLKRRGAREIELAKHKTIHDLADRATELAMQVATESLTNRLNDRDHDRLFESAIVEMAQSAGRTR